VKISCPACAAKYSIADEKVAERLAKIRCRKCGATIVIDGKVSPVNVYTASAAEAAESNAAETADGNPQYSVDFGEGDQRNMSLPEVIAAYQAGQISGETYLWADGFADWKPLTEVPEVVEALRGASPVAAKAAEPSPWAAGGSRAAARPGRAPAADLFGGIDTAGSEEDVTTSAPDAGLPPLGGGGGGLGLGQGAGQQTGARNESSVLFSLSALTAGSSSPATTSRPASNRPMAAASRDDSGLIDLKALTAAATKSDTAAAAPMIAPIAPPLGMPSPLGMASPLGGPSPLGGGLAAASDVHYGGGQKSKSGLFIGLGIAAAAVIIAVAFILRPAPPPPAPPAPVAAAPVAPAPAPTPEPKPEEVTAKPPATGTAEEEKAPTNTTKAVSTRRPSAGGGGVKKPAAASAPAEEKPKPAAPKKNPCGCANGDLQCAMRCAAGG
jgi:predicted Zn finger-like uncharacterized protein